MMSRAVERKLKEKINRTAHHYRNSLSAFPKIIVGHEKESGQQLILEKHELGSG